MEIKEVTQIEFIASLLTTLSQVKTYKKGKYRRYKNTFMTFDIETTNTYEGKKKVGFMYCFQVAFEVDGICYVHIGREWTEFIEIINSVNKFLEDETLIVFVHNLGYEFQFFRRYFDFDKVFAIDKRKPLTATTNNIEFRCMYLLSGLSLENVAKINNLDLKKLDYDYRLIRTKDTILTDEERQYIINDVVIMVLYLNLKLSEEKNITQLPLTKTGFVRRECRQYCLNRKNYTYRSLIKNLVLDEGEFAMCRNAFQGGFVHSNAERTNEILKNVKSFDITSSYPAVMLLEQFPMSKPFDVDLDISNYEQYQKLYCLVFSIKLTNVNTAQGVCDNILSDHKCTITGARILNNGRIYHAEHLTTTLTNIDFEMLNKFYTYETIEFGRCLGFYKNYLPLSLSEKILEFYDNKNTLKGVEGREVEYLKSKEYVNSVYGMCVTNPCKKEIVYCDEWSDETSGIDYSLIHKENDKKSRFLYYPWGVFVTSYARRNVLNAVYELQDKYIYSDTDSIKFTGNTDFFDRYNKANEEKIKKICKIRGLNIDKMIHGVRQLGAYEVDGIYKQFKTLGAKRYAYIENKGNLNITVAGCVKDKGVQYLQKFDNPLDHFNDDLVIPSTESGKLTITYIDEPLQAYITDYQGNISYQEELSYCHIEDVSYKMNLSDVYANFINRLLTNRGGEDFEELSTREYQL